MGCLIFELHMSLIQASLCGSLFWRGIVIELPLFGGHVITWLLCFSCSRWLDFRAKKHLPQI